MGQQMWSLSPVSGLPRGHRPIFTAEPVAGGGWCPESRERHLLQTEALPPRFPKGSRARVLKGSQAVQHSERMSFRQKEPRQAQGPEEISSISPEGSRLVRVAQAAFGAERDETGETHREKLPQTYYTPGRTDRLSARARQDLICVLEIVPWLPLGKITGRETS